MSKITQIVDSIIDKVNAHTGDISNNNGASELVRLDATGKLPAIDGSQLTGIQTAAPNNATITVSGNNGLTGSGSFTTDQASNGSITISHADTSSASSVNNSGATFIQDITLDGYGHVTAIGSVTITPASIGAQPTLVSGTSIKTINNNSLLGSGNIEITGQKYTESDTAPVNPSIGDEWLRTSNGNLYKYISDGVDYVWLDITDATSLKGKLINDTNLADGTVYMYNQSSDSFIAIDIDTYLGGLV